MSALDQVSDLYAAYLKGWDSALLRAAIMFDGSERDAILSLLKREKEPFPAPSGSSFL